MPPKNRKNTRKSAPQTQALVIVPQPRSSTGRKCKICSHASVARINAMIAKGDSFRSISLHFMMSHMSVSRHVRKCLKLDIRAVSEEKRIVQAVDYFEELRRQLEFAKELQEAAREVLTVDETGKVSFMPRAIDIDVIYVDLTDIDPDTKKPRTKIRNLQAIIDKLSQMPEVRNVQSIVQWQDLKDYALRTISANDLLLDKFARIEGRYKDKGDALDEAAELKKLRAIIATRAQQENISFGEMLVIFKENYAHLYRKELVEKLVSEAVN